MYMASQATAGKRPASHAPIFHHHNFHGNMPVGLPTTHPPLARSTI